MTNSPYGTAAHAYQKAKDASLNPVEIVVALYDGILANLGEAKTAYQEQNWEQMCQLNEKSFRIMAALQCHLDHQKGGKTASALDSFYTSLFVRLARVMETTDPYMEYGYLEGVVQDVHNQWKKLAYKISHPIQKS